MSVAAYITLKNIYYNSASADNLTKYSIDTTIENMEKPLTKATRKVLLNLARTGILKFTRSTHGYFKITEPLDRTWKPFNKKSLYTALGVLYRANLISIIETAERVTVSILDQGRNIAEENTVYEKIPRPAQWDGKWRLVFFDIPEKKKNAREAFRYHLKKIGFTEFHTSTFIFPFPCAKEIEMLAARFEITSHIRTATAESIDNEFAYKKHFNLLETTLDRFSSPARHDDAP